MKNTILTILLTLCLCLPVYAGTVSRYSTYTTNSQVTATNLNGNFDNVFNEFNGGIDNDNIDTGAGYRLYEVLGTVPSAGTEGRLVYDTANDIACFDTSSAWKYMPLYTGSAAQGDILYYNGSSWAKLSYGTSGYFLQTSGASANPVWAAASTQVKVVSDTHDISVTGADAVTGVGFTPKAVVVLAIDGAAGGASWGMSDASTHLCMSDNASGTEGTYANSSTVIQIIIAGGGGATSATAVVSFGSDGFTMTWSKNGSPTGTAYLKVLCIG